MEPTAVIAHPVNAPEHSHAGGHKWLTYLAVGTALAAGAVIISPYLFPVLGIGSSDLADNALDAVSSGTGLAGGINSLLGAVPLIGSSLAEGGVTAAVASGAIGIGGVLLGNYVGKREDGTHFIKWGKVINTAALITSALIAMPAILTSISAGIVYLSAVISGLEFAGKVAAFLAPTLGGIAHSHAAVAGAGLGVQIAAHLPHLAAVAFPALSLGLWKKSSRTASLGKMEKQPYSDGSIRVQIEVDTPLSPELSVAQSSGSFMLTAACHLPLPSLPSCMRRRFICFLLTAAFRTIITPTPKKRMSREFMPSRSGRARPTIIRHGQTSHYRKTAKTTALRDLFVLPQDAIFLLKCV